MAEFEIEPTGSSFGAKIHGVRLNELGESAFRALYDTWLDYALLIFPGQNLTKEEQIAFARRFGALEFEMLPISNVKADGSILTPERDSEILNMLDGNSFWHADSTYRPIQAKGAVFCADTIPSNGTQTAWADMRSAYDALSPEMQHRIADLSAYHSIFRSQEELGFNVSQEYDAKVMDRKDPVPLRPLVKIHPETGRKTLLIGRHAYGIPGLSEDDSDRLLAELMEFACQPPRVHEHDWTEGDAVLWDNRSLLHRSRPWDRSKARVMRHTRIAGNPATEGALN